MSLALDLRPQGFISKVCVAGRNARRNLPGWGLSTGWTFKAEWGHTRSRSADSGASIQRSTDRRGQRRLNSNLVAWLLGGGGVAALGHDPQVSPKMD